MAEVVAAVAAGAVVGAAAALQEGNEEAAPVDPRGLVDLAKFSHSETLIDDENFQLYVGSFAGCPEGERAILKVP
jgi:hypothetical protein